jgi:hypothetical protein
MPVAVRTPGICRTSSTTLAGSVASTCSPSISVTAILGLAVTPTSVCE